MSMREREEVQALSSEDATAHDASIGGEGFTLYKREKVRQWEYRKLSQLLSRFEGRDFSEIADFMKMNRPNAHRLFKKHGLK